MDSISSKDLKAVSSDISILPFQITMDSWNTDKNDVEVWNWCISTQFPIHSVIMNDGNSVILEVGSPHQGYTIHAHMNDGRLNGNATIQTPNNSVIAEFNYVQGNMTGPCELYYESGNIFFTGYLKDGYRQGKGTEYNEQGKEIFSGFYDKGRKLYLSPCKEMGRKYWKEMDKDMQLLSVCKVDDLGQYYGTCYFFNNGKIARVSEWRDGKEIKKLKQFSGKTMIEYGDNDKKLYEGEFLDSLELGYPRNGIGAEYEKDGVTKLYKGNYTNGKRNGRGVIYKKDKPNNKMITERIMGYSKTQYYVNQILKILFLPILVIICFIINFALGISVSVLAILLLLIRWKCSTCLGSRINSFTNLELISESTVNNYLQNINANNVRRNSKRKSCCASLSKIIYLLIMIVIIIIAIVPSILYFLYGGPYGIRYDQINYIVESNRGNYLLGFTISNYPNLEYISIRNVCFRNVRTFRIDKLNKLQRLVILDESFTSVEEYYHLDTMQAKYKKKSFHILNCMSLESIEIGKYSFCGFGGEFELKNLPSLQSIQIGTIRSDSYNFYHSSFVIRGILNDIEYVMIRSS